MYKDFYSVVEVTSNFVYKLIVSMRASIITMMSSIGAAPPLNYRLALWTDLAVGANGPPIH